MEDIQGWFSYKGLYSLMVADAHPVNTTKFIEIGAWLGKSTNFMCSEIERSGKNIDFYTVDTWKGSLDEQLHQDIVASRGGDIFQDFAKNLLDRDTMQWVHPIKEE